jgi:ferredoxin
MRQAAPTDLSEYALTGFATWTYYMGVPPLVLDFIQSLPVQNKMPAFVVTTFGMMAGRGLKSLEKAIEARGFMPVDGFSLHTPENYPPFVLKGQGWDSPNAPEPVALQQFQQFIDRLQIQIHAQKPSKRPIRIGFWNSLMKASSLRKVQKDMGPLNVDMTLCNRCGVCQSACAYGAIQMQNSMPSFDPMACKACWNCFNHCPQKAISTARVSATGQFAGLSSGFIQKLPL